MAQPLPPVYGDPNYSMPGQPQEYRDPNGYQWNGQQQQPQQYANNQSTTVTNVIISAPTAQQTVSLVPMKRDWSTPLCGLCMDCGICCSAWFFPFCYTCHLATQMDESCCIGLFTPAALVAMRAKVRAKENITGGICMDTCLYMYCHVCILAQLGREVKAIKARGGSF